MILPTFSEMELKMLQLAVATQKAVCVMMSNKAGADMWDDLLTMLKKLKAAEKHE